LGSIVKFGVGAAELISTCRPGDVGADDAGVGMLLVFADADAGAGGVWFSRTRRSRVSICLPGVPDFFRAGMYEATFSTTIAFSLPWRAVMSFSL
jgi:hypothetical protein